MRKPPRKPPKRVQRANVQHATRIRRGAKGPVVHEEEHVEAVSVDSIEPGDGRVSVGHDMKLWASEETGGMTAGCMVNVGLTCTQGFEAMSLANDAASDLALSFLKRNLHHARDMMRRFKDEDRRR